MRHIASNSIVGGTSAITIDTQMAIKKKITKRRSSVVTAWLAVHMTMVQLMEALLADQLRRTGKGTVSGLMVVSLEVYVTIDKA